MGTPETIKGAASTKGLIGTAGKLSLGKTALAADIREERNSKLSETDWIGLSDVRMSTEWATYRQELRDVPEQAEFPNTIIWPTEPS